LDLTIPEEKKTFVITFDSAPIIFSITTSFKILVSFRGGESENLVTWIHDIEIPSTEISLGKTYKVEVALPYEPTDIFLTSND
jgi:hypothetical protein